MAVLLPPTATRGFAALGLVQERNFRLHLRCADCSHVEELTIRLFDEVDDPATATDFYESGALGQIEYACERCGCEAAIVVGEVEYVPTASEASDVA
jgi:hypothetical protein